MTESKRTNKLASALPPELASEATLDLSGHEGQFVEFKQSLSDIAKEMVGFANAEGGRIYIGVADSKEIKGISIDNRLLSQVQSTARNCDPAIPIKLYPFKRDEKDLLLIQVPQGENKPYGCSDGYFLRTGPSSQKMNRSELVAFFRAMDVIPWEKQECKRFIYPKDFNPVAFKTFLRMAEISSGLSREDLLVNLELARIERDVLVVNNACVLFFAKEPARFLPQARVTCILYQAERIDILDRKDLEGGLFENAEQAEVFLLSHLRVRYEIKGFKRINHHEVPMPALREGILNALIHRDYAIYGGNVSMEIDPSQLLISNPGGLPPGLAPRRFGHASVRRNALIADLFHRVGKVERAGSGIRRIREAMEAEQALEPQFKFDTFFDLVFPRYTPKQWSDLATEEGTGSGGTPQVPPKYPSSTPQVVPKLKLLEFCMTPRGLREMLDYMELKDRKTFMQKYLRPLLKKGLLMMTDPGSPKSPKQKYMMTLKGLESLKGESAS